MQVKTRSRRKTTSKRKSRPRVDPNGNPIQHNTNNEPHRIPYRQLFQSIGDVVQVNGLRVGLDAVEPNSHVDITLYEKGKRPQPMTLPWKYMGDLCPKVRIKVGNNGDTYDKPHEAVLFHVRKGLQGIEEITQYKDSWSFPSKNQITIDELFVKGEMSRTIVNAHSGIADASRIQYASLEDGTELAYAWLSLAKNDFSAYFVKNKASDEYEAVALCDTNGRICPPNSKLKIFREPENLAGLEEFDFANTLRTEYLDAVKAFRDIESHAANNNNAQKSWNTLYNNGRTPHKQQLRNAITLSQRTLRPSPMY